MYTPHTVTVYNIIRETDPETLRDTERMGITILRGVMLQAESKATAHEPGQADSSSVVLYIPLNVAAEDAETGAQKIFAAPSTYSDTADRTGLWTLSAKNRNVETLLVKGESQTDDLAVLRGCENSWKVTGIALRDFGSADMQHWEVQGA